MDELVFQIVNLLEAVQSTSESDAAARRPIVRL